MKLAYLINQYPQPSHSFIRREIVALEESGMPVSRFTIRRSSGPLPDIADLEEQKKTYSVLEQGVAALLVSMLWAFLTRPAAAIQTLFAALSSGWEYKRGHLIRLVYFAEACLLARRFQEEKIDFGHAPNAS